VPERSLIDRRLVPEHIAVNQDLANWSQGKFGIGQPVPRNEDPTLLCGAGRYADDVKLPGAAHGVMLRSRHAHGRIAKLDTKAARAMPGVLAIYTEADMAGYAIFPSVFDLKNRDGTPMRMPQRHALAAGKVRFVGDPIAMVVAETQAQARDAIEAIALEIEALPAVIDPAEAAKPGAPLLFDEVASNTVLDFHFGDSAAVSAAFAKAAHVTRLAIRNTRVVVAAMEPRAGVATYDKASGRFTFYTPCQGVFGLRAHLAKIMGVANDKLRVITDQVGGSFGMKSGPFPEQICLLHAARALGRPVRWVDDRGESFQSDTHGRDHDIDAELALDREGRFLAVRVKAFANLGGYLAHAALFMGTNGLVKNTTGVYATPLVEISSRNVLTNTTPINAYRGAGRPEGNYIMERLVDAASRELGIDRIELRKRNHVKPSEMPFASPGGAVYDSGEFTALLDRAIDAADWKGFAKRKADSAAKGKLRGIGIGNFLEITADRGKEMGGVRFESDGTVTIVTGTLDYGQGHATPFAQILAAKLGIPFEKIRLHQGDSDRLIAGGGTGGSRSAMQSGTAILTASDAVIERGKQIASVVLEAAVADIQFASGRFTIVGTDRSVGLLELAERLRGGLSLPADTPRSLDIELISDGVVAAAPNGAHIAEVEIDRDTGATRVVRYTTVNDFGTLINPMVVAGQAHGGIVQGIGQALMENVSYDSDGQLVTGSFMDYAMPRASDIPDLVFESRPVPATTNPLGAKGCAEAGCAGSLPAVVNAINDALATVGVKQFEMPATPQRVWEAMRAARR
jgi:carbon-monoxide dehydrogenase large subunit